MVDYEDELLADIDSLSEEEDVEVNEKFEPEVSGSFENKLKDILNEDERNILDFDHVQDLKTLSRVIAIVPELREKLEFYSNDENSDYMELISWLKQNTSEEFKFISLVNELISVINEEIMMFHSIAKSQYSLVFPELETLVFSAVDYAKTVLLVKQDLIGIKNHEEEMRKFISNEKVLVIIMAGLQQVKKRLTLDDNDMRKLTTSCELVLELNDILQELGSFVASKISLFAPNVSAIIGSVPTSQILIATGSLKQLSLTPSCNLPSLGVRDLSSKTRTISKTIRQTGYLYHSDLIRYLPEDIIKPALRIVSGKVILAARLDLSKASPNGSFGKRILQEINSKIEKLLTPPENHPDRALPIPVDQKSKKRGGKRFRKMRERLQMSELRRAQNRMEFGKTEETVIDSFGEEIGLGMSRSNDPNSGRIRAIRPNSNTKAKMSKAMSQRLDSIELPSVSPSTQSNTVSKIDLYPSSLGVMFSGMSKRKLDSSENISASKKPHK
ncbi:uncharacterized protein PRCAT00004734001 [Priceomyces carsonii]|uniref:uncharacterized protein n=1 Tax=Priceomyces carsonii TaxID=28549 RepID=UPI002EDB78F4|nr:unnamed protein product [Priceomyces carsonii]